MLKKIMQLAAFALVFSGHASAAPLPRADVPDPLKSWIPWVLDEETDAGCPHLFNDEKTRHCAWPAALDLKAAASGASFTQDWTAYRETWVALPGDEQHWPQEVSIDGKPAVVLSREDVPSLKLGPGQHHIAGRFPWSAMPESLALPVSAGLVRLDLEGRPVAVPVRDDDNRLWLQRKAEAEGVEQAQVLVHRKITDGVPITVETRIRLEVSGKGRELTVGRALLPDLIPKELRSPLPAALAQDGSLKIQARAGTWEIVLVGRHPGPLKALSLPAGQGLLVPDEVWVFEAAPLVRSASVEGPASVDPQQTSLPKEWRRFPAYLMRTDSRFGLKEVSRGDSNPGPDKLLLNRTLWLSFDGSTMTQSDTIQGEVSRTSRLTMNAPAQLGRIGIAGQDQLITRGSDNLAGIELKRGELRLDADSLAAGAPRHFSAVGWQHDFDRVWVTLSLPPGWRLLHAGGPDSDNGAWLSRWNLLDFFLVLVTALAIGKLWGRRWAFVALALLVLSYQEPDAPHYAWLVLLALAALVRVLPASRFKTWLAWMERASLLALILFSLAFATVQVRGALYPVLAAHSRDDRGLAGGAHDEAPMEYAQGRVAAPAAPAEMKVETPPLPEADRNVEEPKQAGALSAKIIQPVNIPPPAVIVSESMPKEHSSRFSVKASAGASPQKRKLEYQTIDPDAKVQTGPGLPSWYWNQYHLTWDGPVRQDQEINLWLLPPWANAVLVVLRLVLLALLLARIAGISLPTATGKGGKLLSRFGIHFVFACLALSGVAHSERAYAQMPDDARLTQLKEKLLRAPDCLPECAEISRLSVQAAGSTLRLGLDIDAAVDTALPLPGGAKHWLPREARLDGKPAYIQRDEQGALWLLTPAGRHRVELTGELPSGNTVQLPLPRKPRLVDISAAEWDVSGLSEDTGAADTLQLTRRQKSDKKAGANEAPALPPFLHIERRLVLDLVWRVETTVSRNSPPGVPALVQVPLLAGESVTSAGINVKDGKVLVNLGPQAESMSWSSTLKQGPAITLSAPAETAWAETWIVAASSLWHISAEGIPPVAVDAAQDADLAFRPWPGETLKLKIERPQAIPGQTLTIDHSALHVVPGTRATDYRLSLVIRSSRGIDHSLTLPEGAILQSVAINGQVRPIRANGRQLVLPLAPGKQSIDLAWRVNRDMAMHFATLPVGLGSASVNSSLEMEVPNDRWLLLLGGPGVGPAILFWGKLLVLLAVACALGQVGSLPMKTRHWLLLAVGLTQVPWWCAAIVIAWFSFFAKRAQDPLATQPRWLFNLRQLALVALTVALLAILFNAVAGGLLGRPDMQITGNDSHAGQLNWYLDRAEPELQGAWMLTLPMLAYRGLMLAWAMWLAWSLLAWLKWGWAGFGQGGLWRKKTLVQKSAEQNANAKTPAPKKNDKPPA